MARALVKTHSSSSIGSIKESMLDEATFQSIHGTGWILMDGRDVTGSGYHTLTTNTTVPDARGQFLRGKNNGRSDGQEDSEGERTIGSHQLDKTRRPRDTDLTTDTDGAHTHSLIDGSGSGTRRYASVLVPNVEANGTGAGTLSAGNHTHSITGGGDTETQPKNIAVNYFIKINEE